MDDALRLALESGLPYTGLRDVSPDPRLWHYVPPAYAQEHRVVPVTLIGDVLHLASAETDPDLSSLRERFPKLELALHIAPEAEIRAALGRAHGHDA